MDAAPLGVLDDHLGAVDVAGQNVRALVDETVRRLRFLHRQRPVAGEYDRASDGWTLRAPSAKALMLRSTCGIGLPATKPSFLDFVAWPATMPFRYWHSSIK